jgi:hypothetical protein
VFNLEKKVFSIYTQVQDSISTIVQESVHADMQQIFKGNNFNPNLEDPQASHYHPNNSSHSLWGSLHSWNKVPKLDMHKFDGSNLAGWISQMEQYFSLVKP